MKNILNAVCVFYLKKCENKRDYLKSQSDKGSLKTEKTTFPHSYKVLILNFKLPHNKEQNLLRISCIFNF
jgi:hypothetical protein